MGRANYDSWVISAENYLKISGYWSCIRTEMPEDADEKVKGKYEVALAELGMLIDQSCFSAIQGVTSAGDAWAALKKAYTDTSLGRRVQLLSQLVNVRLEECSSAEEYVDMIINLWFKVKAAGFAIDEDIAAGLMLANMPKQYGPAIFGIGRSGEKLTVDYVRTLVLQDIIADAMGPSEAVLAVKDKKKQRTKKDIKCFNCKGPHFLRKCPEKTKNKSGEACLMMSFFAKDSADWYIDSGASSHMTGVKSCLSNIRDIPQRDVVVANNEKIVVECMGDTKAAIKCNGADKEIVIRNVQYVPTICANLLSVSQMTKSGLEVFFDENGCKIFDGRRNVIATGTLESNMYKLDTVKREFACVSKSADDLVLWHRRLGHISFSNMSFLNGALKLNLKRGEVRGGGEGQGVGCGHE